MSAEHGETPGSEQIETPDQISMAQRIINETPVQESPLVDRLRVSVRLRSAVSKPETFLDITQETIRPEDINRLSTEWQPHIRANGGIRIMMDAFGQVSELKLLPKGKV